MWSRWTRSLQFLALCSGATALCVTVVAIAAFLASISNPWLIGIQNEPHWSCAIGSGRLKVWVAELGFDKTFETWTASWYRGLDGRPIRWDFTFSRGSTGGIVVIAIPLWAIAAVSGAGGINLIGAVLISRLPKELHALSADRDKDQTSANSTVTIASK